MTEDTKEPEVEEGIEVSGKLLLALSIGFVVIIIGIVLVVIGSFLADGSSSIGGVIFIGPFPIVFGAGPNAAWLIIIGIVIAIIMVVLLFLLR
ncbi:MAG: TIGR00304 family membrane protein, partial [Chloroflexota bacterium]